MVILRYNWTLCDLLAFSAVSENWRFSHSQLWSETKPKKVWAWSWLQNTHYFTSSFWILTNLFLTASILSRSNYFDEEEHFYKLCCIRSDPHYSINQKTSYLKYFIWHIAKMHLFVMRLKNKLLCACALTEYTARKIRISNMNDMFWASVMFGMRT